MEEILLFIIFALCTGSFMYLLVCTDSNSKTPMGMMRRQLYQKGPILIKKIFGDKIFLLLQRIYNYIFYTNNSLGQISYCLIFWSAFSVYFKYGLLQHFGNNPIVSHIHTVFGTIIFLFCNFTFYKTCVTDPGIINKDNYQQYVQKYEEYYDEIQYKKNIICQTCNFIKPARSKHCRICNVCVSRFDHHCIWVKQCIGQNNYIYFLLFLFSHILLSLYGVIAGILCLYGIAIKLQLFKLTFKNSITGEIHQATFLRVLGFLINRETFFVFIIFICFIFWVTLTAFFLYHLKLVRNDLTTNERVRKNEFEKSFLGEVYILQEQLKSKKDDDANKRLLQLKQCWKSLNNRKKMSLINGLKKIIC